MSEVEIKSGSLAELIKLVIEMPPEEIPHLIPQLNLGQLSELISHLNADHVPDWKIKIVAILQALKDKTQLEVAGGSLSVPQLLAFFDNNFLSQEDGFNKLLAILVGMSHQTFSELLGEISDHQLHVLLQTSLFEPLQHHLTILNHELSNKFTLANVDLERLYQEIKHLSMENIGRNELIDIKNRINDISLEFNKSLVKINHALKLAWNTHRADLVENLNRLKNNYVHTLSYFIGHPETPSGATGLYEQLQEQIYTVFGNPYDLNDPEALSNGEPAIEALVKFSIWYLKDYWTIGLLPNIQSESELELDINSHNEQERASHREKLFFEVQSNLEKMHLKTLWDLKKAHIYSKKALIEYLSWMRSKEL